MRCWKVRAVLTKPARKLRVTLLFLMLFGVLVSCGTPNKPVENAVSTLEPTAENLLENPLEFKSQVTLDPKEGRIIHDPAASDAKAAALYRTGEGVRFELTAVQSGRYEVSVRARGEPYGGPPILRLQLDGQQLSEDKAVEASAYSEQPFGQVDLRQGQTLKAIFTNDKWGGMREADRNVYIDHVTLTPVEASGPDDLPRVQARPAAAFTDTIGVNTHLNYQDRVYFQRYDDLIKPKLLKLGVRHLRDGVYTQTWYGPDSPYYARLRELGAAGIEFNLITTLDTRYHVATDYSKLADIVTWTNGAVTSFEGINEPDLQHLSDWVALTRAAQEKLYMTVRGNPVLNGVAVLGPSVVWSTNDMGDLSRFLDYGSVHPYPGGKMPTGSEFGQSTDAVLAGAAVNSGDKPVLITETGYHNALHADSDHLPTSEAVTAKYLPRLLFEHFNRGVPRSYLYELIDGVAEGRLTDLEASFGLLRHDGTEKPAYRALQNLIALLDDDAAGSPGTLQFALEGNTENVHHTLLQKSDGTFYLALWLETPSWNRHERKETDVPAQKVTLRLGSPASRLRLHIQKDGGAMGISDLTPESEVEVSVTDSLSVLELDPHTFE